MATLGWPQHGFLQHYSQSGGARSHHVGWQETCRLHTFGAQLLTTINCAVCPPYKRTTLAPAPLHQFLLFSRAP